jgi:2-dehydropantoate 2-reductase
MMHVIGLGSVGHLVAHHVRLHAGRQVTLLLRPTPRNAAISGPTYELCVQTRDQQEISRGYAIELLDGRSTDAIQTLLVCTKAYDTAAAVGSVASRLNDQSTVVLMNNGLGVLEELDMHWRAGQKPKLVEAILTHGVYGVEATSQRTTVRHAGTGDMTLSSPELVETFSSLSARSLDEVAFKTAQLTKFIINCCVNPLTAIHRCYNGQVRQYTSTMQDVMQECLAVLHCAYPAVPFDATAVQIALDAVITKTAGNCSSMLQDVMAGRETELAYLNGHVCKLASVHGIHVPVNSRLIRQL